MYATRAYFTYTKKSGISMTRSVTVDFGEDGKGATTYTGNIAVDENRRTIDIDGILNQDRQ